jgi:hypothetical protein
MTNQVRAAHSLAHDGEVFGLRTAIEGGFVSIFDLVERRASVRRDIVLYKNEAGATRNWQILRKRAAWLASAPSAEFH